MKIAVPSTDAAEKNRKKNEISLYQAYLTQRVSHE